MQANKKNKARVMGFESPSDIILRTIHGIGKKADKAYLAHTVFLHWEDIVGKGVANHVLPQGIRRDTLYLYTDNSALRNELMMLQGKIIAKINAYVARCLVRKIVFTSKWEKAVASKNAENLYNKSEQVDLGAEKNKIALTDTQLARAEELAAISADDDISKKAKLIYEKFLKLQELKLKLGYHRCPDCGKLIKPEDEICYDCQLREKDKKLASIRQVLVDIPWAHFADVKKYVPAASTREVNYERARLVDKLCGEVMADDTESLKARTLVMLYRQTPPDKLTADIMARTIYELRVSLVKPANYRTPKRYEAIKLGKRTGGKKDVSPPR